MERRSTDRRLRPVGIRWPERRTGFDRRGRAAVTVLRDSSFALIVMLGLLNVLNVLDLRFTLIGLERGAVEVNPVMTSFLGLGPSSAAIFKVAIMLAVSLTIWAGRRYRRILEFAVLATGIYAALIVYHIVGLSLILPSA
jgi:hypothetical protein